MHATVRKLMSGSVYRMPTDCSNDKFDIINVKGQYTIELALFADLEHIA